ncbi:PKD-like family lipoprotein [Pedobacter sp.]|uniref:PKD-like family lipoprotein n=1 Tax=Pedobacter sp. TaxID=1411316 RepID=UPI002D1D5A4C|nr:PKD-like family lipoprotein [Pedobacter sp.]HWW39784.1 PKD-like family lipoprotein [Pedobacter sp.]
MKRIYKKYAALLFLLIAVLLVRCTKDHSNQDLTPVNLVALSDPKSKAVFTVFQGDTLKLKPTLSQSMGNDLSQLEFSWLVYNNNGALSLAAPRITISNEYELKYLVKGDPFILGEPYVVRLTVKNKATGVNFFLNYNILIGNKYGTGWLVLEDKSGKGDLSFVFPDNTVEHGIYTDRNTTQLVGPRKLELTPFPVGDDISAVGKRLYILAQSGSQEYNYLTMVKKFDYSYEFFSPPAVQNPQVMTWTSQYVYSGVRSPALGIVVNNNKAHSNLVGGFPGVKKWGDVALNPQGSNDYSLAPFVVGGPTYPAIVYDNKDKRFYHIRAYNPSPVAGSLESFPSGGTAGVSSVFEMNNVGMTMLFQDSADVVHEYNALMKNDDNQAYLLRYKTTNTTAAPNITLAKVLMNAPGILTYTAAAGSTSTPHIYYSNDNKVSCYETSSNTVVESYSFPVGEQITAIKYAKYTPNDTDPVKKARLVVATWNGTEGRLYYFTISSTGSMGNYTNMFKGFGKIVDIAYKY